MTSIIKENLFIGIATLFLGFTLAFSFTANGKIIEDGCVSCGGERYGDNSCYPVDLGANSCWDNGYTCNNIGSCENGEPQL